MTLLMPVSAARLVLLGTKLSSIACVKLAAITGSFAGLLRVLSRMPRLIATVPQQPLLKGSPRAISLQLIDSCIPKVRIDEGGEVGVIDFRYRLVAWIDQENTLEHRFPFWFWLSNRHAWYLEGMATGQYEEKRYCMGIMVGFKEDKAWDKVTLLDYLRWYDRRDPWVTHDN
jgi:hypothetical protein